MEKMVKQLPKGTSTADRLDLYSIPEPNSGCFLWLGYTNPKGYGTMKVGGEMFMAHRVAYMEHVGPIPENRFVLHRCDTPSCVNPEHLFIGTNQDNVDDKVKKGRHGRGPRNGNARLSWKQVAEIKSQLARGDMSVEEIAIQYPVGESAIRHIKSGQTWDYCQGLNTPEESDNE